MSYLRSDTPCTNYILAKNVRQAQISTLRHRTPSGNRGELPDFLVALIPEQCCRSRCMVEQGRSSRRLICHARACNMRVPLAAWHSRVILYACANDSSYYAVKPSAINIRMILVAACRRGAAWTPRRETL